MLPGVLLHVIEAAIPVDPSGDLADRRGAIQHVRNAIALIHYFLNGDAADMPEIVRLSAGGWIEGSTVEVNARTGAIDYPRVEFTQVRIRVIQAFC